MIYGISNIKHSRYEPKLSWLNQYPQQNDLSIGIGFGLFETNELLCKRNELNYLNLRGFFVNAIKAMHLCWLVARNNQRLVFISSKGHVARHDYVNNCILGQSKRYSIPAIVACTSLTPVGFASANNYYLDKRKSGFKKVTKLCDLSASYIRITIGQKEYKLSKRSVSKSHFYQPYMFELKAIASQVFSRLPASSVYANKPGFISNAMNRSWRKNTSHPLTNSPLNKPKLSLATSPKKSPVKRLKISNVSQFAPCNEYITKTKMPDEVDDVWSASSKGQTEDGLEYKYSRNLLAISAPNIGHKDYESVVKQSVNASIKSYVTHPFLLNADVVFFLHPEHNTNLVRQAKASNIPTIGVVSGKVKHSPSESHNFSMDDLVDYCMVGNPDSLFFISRLVVTTLKVMQHA